MTESTSDFTPDDMPGVSGHRLLVAHVGTCTQYPWNIMSLTRSGLSCNLRALKDSIAMAVMFRMYHCDCSWGSV